MFAVSELLNMDEDTRSKVIEKMTTERDLRNQMAYARKEAIAEGLAEGRAEGRAEGISFVIRQMIAKGMSPQQIADIVEMPIEEIQAII
jgi:predicted transposase/invertase (TIGR01784 family)